MKTFETMFDDLTETTQADLLLAFQTTPEEENWDVMPLAIISREE